MLSNTKKLRTKLYFGFFVIPATILVGISIYSLLSFFRIDREVGLIYDDRIVPLLLLKSVEQSYAVEIIDAANKVNEGIIGQTEALAVVESAQNNIEQNWSDYTEIEVEERERQLIKEARDRFAVADVQIEQLKESLRRGDRDRIAQLDGELYRAIDPVSQTLRKLSEIQLEMAAIEREKAGKIVNETVWIYTILLAIAVVGASPFGYVFSQSILSKLRETVNRVSRSSSEIAAAAEEQEQVATQQASAVNQTTSTIEELNASSQQSARQAQVALDRAKQVLTLVDSASVHHEGVRDRGEGLRQKVDRIAEQTVTLMEQVQTIDKIADMVSTLANQTNVLALNASVEAVRAGGEGKGFGVVASEIRKLADESRKAAERINQLVCEIESATDLTVRMSVEGKQTVGIIVEAINEIVVNSQQISLTSKQQAIALDQVVTAMSSINAGSKETASGIAQTKESTHKLNEAVRTLSSMV